jgi:hypothetical protein
MEGRSWTWKASFVAARIIAVYLFVHALIVLAQAASFLFGSNGGLSRWADVIAIAVLAVGGLLLWLSADGVANRIAGAADELDLPADEDDPEPFSRPTSSIDASAAMSIGLTLLGIVILVDGVSSLILIIGELVQINSSFFGGAARTPLYFSLVISAFRIGIGAWLVFGSQDIAGLLNRLRSRPTEPTEPEP